MSSFRVRPICIVTFVFYVIGAVSAQTFEINGQKSQPAPAKPQAKQGNKAGETTKSDQSSGQFAWGTSIDVARQSRAAEDALKRGDYNAAANYANHAATAAPQETRLWLLAGYASRLAGRNQASVEAYKRSLQNDPNSVEGLSGLAQTYARMGKFSEAKVLLLRVIALNPKRANDLQIAGEMFLQAGDAKSAVEMLSRSESITPASRTELLLASSYLKMKEPARAKEFLQRAQRRDPNNKEVLRSVANFDREAKDFNGAIAILKRIAGKSPDIIAELGYTYELAQRYPESADAYAEAANLAPGQIAYQIDAASSYVHIGNNPKAQVYLARAAVIDPNHYRLHGLLGEIARSENRLADAAREYTVALNNMPESVPEGLLYPIQIRMNLSDAYRDSGDDNSAKTNATLALNKITTFDVDPSHKPEYLRLRASAKTTLGDFASAQQDIKEALAIEPNDTNMMLQFGNLLWKSKHTAEAGDMFKKVLVLDPKNRAALTQLGFLSRELGDTKASEDYFVKLVSLYPKDYAAYLALGDLYTSQRIFDKADGDYQAAYKLNQTNPMIVAGGANAGIEAHKFDLAKVWLDRATAQMNDHPFVMRERERYLTWEGKYLEAAKLGYKVIEKLPKDRDAVVYLGYSLLYLGRFDDLLRLTSKYEPILSRDAALPLLTGYVYRKSELLDDAVAAFSRSIERSDKAATAFVNRGYVLNDLQNPQMASKDFKRALELEPNNGEADLGLAFSYLQLHQPSLTLDYVDRAAKVLGESKTTHLARAGGYRQRLLLSKAEGEYREALKADPESAELRIALAQTLMGEKRYEPAIGAYQNALSVTDDHALIYASMANASAHLHRKDDALRYITAAENESGDSAAVLLASGDTLLALNDPSAAMEHYARALAAPDTTRVDVRLAFARTFQNQGKWDDARQQIALAFTEARIGESSPITPENLATAASIFLAMNDFELASKYYNMAKDAGADDRPVHIGLANTYLAQGDYRKADAELAEIGTSVDNVNDFDYMLAYANLNRQRRDNRQAMLGFAHAHQLEADDDSTERALHEVSGDEGYSINKNLSLASDFHLEPIFEDATVYDLDAKIRGIVNPALLPSPRSSVETLIATNYRLHYNSFPTVLGTYSLRNAHGQFVFPSDTNGVFNRNTFDTNIGFGINPVFHLGATVVSLTPGVQFTLRRDKSTPVDLDQNLTRSYLYLSTTPLFNWLSFKGNVIYETGPFTQRTLNSRDASAAIEFTVGRPWGRTALITGYRTRDLLFNPITREYFTTSTYVGLQRKFGKRMTAAAYGEYIRSWRVDISTYAISQAMRPAGKVTYRANNRWQVDANFAYTKTEASPVYDNMNSGFLVTYTRPYHRNWIDAAGSTVVEYPLQFSFGIQQQSFMNFPGQKKSSFVPVIRFTLF